MILVTIGLIKSKVCIQAKWPIRPELICSIKQLGVFLLPPGMLVHRRVTPSSKFTSTHLYTWVESGTMGVKCLAQEHNTVPRPGLKPGPLGLIRLRLNIVKVWTILQFT